MNNWVVVLFSSSFSMCLDEERYSPWTTFFWVSRRTLLSENYRRNLLKGIVLNLKTKLAFWRCRIFEDHFCLYCIWILMCFGMVGICCACFSLFEAEESSMPVVILLSYHHLLILQECNKIAGWTIRHSWLYNGSFILWLSLFPSLFFLLTMGAIHLFFTPLHGTSLC